MFKVEEDEKIAREKLLADEAKRKADEPIIPTTPCAKNNNNMIKKKVGRKSKVIEHKIGVIETKILNLKFLKKKMKNAEKMRFFILMLPPSGAKKG